VDLSVSFNKQTAKAFVAANMAPESLIGRNIRIRGILELRPGPQIEVAGPAALQIIGR
jgi:predicted lipoprotein